ncbi:putative heterogeneous nuclear ribonucleoprotein H/F [Trypanosoma rangeli]|uniref:Putative heterogeneous nuclear ribonucleoprotein H/F n=1 Tax=Trypanosoma rangeli TaxID=5698 RepID=A0A3R7NG18_TRYRA|nr:putative heterogeneous nuclear ribonucleoprotein H/F [Trypanosoma rangeli]RNF02173.1 putative heterogeneous nuclear ribonucleoprotein H/F [Trypanosoma rangeli]|eukprot:RNF02173.1 putative heterogeneous nuclear ribonucleoprotein H/F [Trypanosoma rangeli]
MEVPQQQPPRYDQEEVDVRQQDTTAGANQGEPRSGGVDFSVVQESRVLRLHGLPYSVQEETIRAFFADFELADEDAVLHFTEGLHRGTGFIRLKNAEDVEEAIKKLHRHHIDSNRYVEVTASTEEERQRTLEQQEQGCKTHVLRLRGLPFNSTEEDVREFIKSVSGVTRVDICRDLEGRNTGDAFIQLATEEDVEETKQLHNKTMGSRYIEVLPSTMYDRDAIMRAASLRARRDRRGARAGESPQMGSRYYGNGAAPGAMQMLAPNFFDPFLAAACMGYMPQVAFGNEFQQNTYDRGGMPQGAPYGVAGGPQPLFPMFPGQPPMMTPRAPSAHVVRIRGVPYSATEESIAEFFAGVKIPPQGVHMVYNEQNRPTGEAFVELENDSDVVAALERNGGAMGNRYIEVFQSSVAAMQRLGSPLTGMNMMQYPMPGLGIMPQSYC